jgi:glycosyltransferase involved in cell wall biosynthesis
MLDAAACGIPIIVNHTMSAPERVEGNGLVYKLNDRASLVSALAKVVDRFVRAQMGAIGAEKMRAQFSWKSVAARRVSDYEASLSARSASHASEASSLNASPTTD